MVDALVLPELTSLLSSRCRHLHLREICISISATEGFAVPLGKNGAENI